MIKQLEIILASHKRGYHLITRELESKLPVLPNTGIAHFFIMHTSAALTINENADPSVRTDFESFMNKIVPDGDKIFIHRDEGSDDMSAHLKSSILGAAVTIPIVNGRLHLGTWQGIYLCEFRNYAEPRRIFVTIMGE
ncbi:MAG: secondary thiamine-phosphate synthase enzyme YjbQ [Mariniphaga sp.]